MITSHQKWVTVECCWRWNPALFILRRMWAIKNLERKKCFRYFYSFSSFSQVDLNVRVSVEEVDNIHEQGYYALSGHKINVRSTVDAKAASTNESIRSWDVNVNIDLSPGHMVNNLKVQMMRKTPGEKNLNVRLILKINYKTNWEIYYKLQIKSLIK